MTQHLRTSYRRHRKGTWGVALGAVALLAAVVIPLASGGSGKTYSLGVNPLTVCAGGSTTVTLTNTARTQTLGSAEIYFPPNSVSSASRGNTPLQVRTGAGLYPGSWDIIGPVNNLGLAFGQPLNINVTLKSTATGGQVRAVVKQSNQFNDSAGTANLFDIPPSWPQLTVGTCKYFFTQQPSNAVKNVAQTVKVIYGPSVNSPVPVPGGLTLSAYQTQQVNGNPTQVNVDGRFEGRGSLGQDSTNTWIFSSLTGTVSGADYSLQAGTGAQAATSQPPFVIADCIPVNGVCSQGFTDNGDGTGGAAFNGAGLTSPGIVLSFESLPSQGVAICGDPTTWGWKPLEFPLTDGRTNFDGITLGSFGFSRTNGFMKVTTYLRNDLFVLTSANQTNDIQICAGALHANSANATAQGSTSRAFKGRNGILAKWDTATGLYWGVLQRIPNCNNAPSHVDAATGDTILDPALCAWGTQTVAGVLYRTATVLIPYDWDYKGGH
jgi:hypothetical protein